MLTALGDSADAATRGAAGTSSPTATTPNRETRPETNHIASHPTGNRITCDESAMKMPTPAKCTQASDDRPARASPSRTWLDAKTRAKALAAPPRKRNIAIANSEGQSPTAPV